MGSLCPKCHQTVEEDAVCCAGIEFQWRCSQCGKRSRGLAFPFGQCPACGGTLEFIQGGQDPTDAQMRILQEAIQIEVSSYLFYKRLAEAVDDPETADFFESMSAMEREHAYDLGAKYHIPIEVNLFEDRGHRLPQPFFGEPPPGR